MLQKTCPCQSGKPFALCCKPLLQGQRFAKTPVQLMRSRYSAFALGGYGDYLLATWADEHSAALTSASLAQRSADWQGLEIVNKTQQGEQARVEFKAFYVGLEGGNSEILVHHEQSEFVRRQGRWLYLRGDVLPSIVAG